MSWIPDRLVSGGQTGVDRAALDVALTLGVPCGGWCPKGRRAEDGPIDERYPLKETPRVDYAERTAWNIRDSDATLIISPEPLAGGTKLTAELARRQPRPCMAVDPVSDPDAAAKARAWLDDLKPDVLNVAGPRASKTPDHYRIAYDFLISLLGAETA
ncbi:MAG: putative molybdenum carrier protein [Pseudomonadota bacterium]